MQGNWKDLFKNDNPIILELACGKGEYTVGLAELYPGKNFIGVDIKGNRMWRGAKTSLEEGLHNVAFLRTQIEKIDEYFNRGEVSEVWITFPDPQLATSRTKKRLTHPRFLRLYQNIMGATGVIHLKTDSPDLYKFTHAVIGLFQLNLLEDHEYSNGHEQLNSVLNIRTHYESLDISQSNKIHYLKFALNAELPIEKDEELKQVQVEEDPG
jgi:tRNA (guanine-N7-)-methyltransferase